MSHRARRAVVRAAREMERRGLVVGSTGNVSARVRDGIAITPTRAAYAGLRSRDLITVAPSGEVVRGGRAPSRELLLHLAIYARRRDAHAVIHTHSVYATAWSLRGGPLDVTVEDLDYYGIGTVRCAPQAPAGSSELGEAAADALGSAKAVLLGGHGVLAVGADPGEALLVARVVEYVAQVGTIADAWGTSATRRDGAGWPITRSG